jgi:hypothetical protein
LAINCLLFSQAPDEQRLQSVALHEHLAPRAALPGARFMNLRFGGKVFGKKFHTTNIYSMGNFLETHMSVSAFETKWYYESRLPIFSQIFTIF